MRKADLTFHRLGYGSTRVPAVNVKCYTSPSVKDWARLQHDYPAPGFDQTWIDTYLSDDERNRAWDWALNDGWEMLQDFARDIYGPSAKVYSEGRSAGWAYVADLPDPDGWDAIALGRWARFAAIAHATAQDTPYRYIQTIGQHFFEPWHTTQRDLVQLGGL